MSTISAQDLFVFIDDQQFKDEAKRRGFDLMPVKQHTCGYCGQAIEGARTNQRYCSEEHKRRAAMQRAARPEVHDKNLERQRRYREENREEYNAYARQYQRDYRRLKMTAEQKERHRVQQLASYHRRMARIEAIREDGAA